MAKKRTAKPSKKPKIKVRAPRPKIRAITDAPKGRKSKKSKETNQGKQGARVTSFKPNGKDSAEVIAPPANAIDLGPILMPDAEDSQRVLQELAEMHDKAAHLKARWESLKDAAKSAKDRYDEATEQIMTRLRQATHKSDLPLFDMQEREEDHARMTAGTAAPAALVDRTDAIDGEGEAEQGPASLAVPASDVADFDPPF